MATTTTVLAIPIPTIAVGSEADTDNYDTLMQTAEDNMLDTFAPIPVVASAASSATPTPAVGAAGADILYILTALAEAATFGAPTGTPAQGQKLTIRIKDNATARALSWNAIYKPIGVVLPTTTVISKLLYVTAIYNSTSSQWDVVGVSQEA
jgi:hypothetical protein